VRAGAAVGHDTVPLCRVASPTFRPRSGSLVVEGCCSTCVWTATTRSRSAIGRRAALSSITAKEGVDLYAVGKRRHGKEQLRIDEARRWQAKAIEFADEGADGSGGRDDLPPHGDAVHGDGASGRPRPGRRGEAALDSGLEDVGWTQKVAGA
jgi:hypothetical protein